MLIFVFTAYHYSVRAQSHWSPCASHPSAASRSDFVCNVSEPQLVGGLGIIIPTDSTDFHIFQRSRYTTHQTKVCLKMGGSKISLAYPKWSKSLGHGFVLSMVMTGVPPWRLGTSKWVYHWMWWYFQTGMSPPTIGKYWRYVMGYDQPQLVKAILGT